MARYRDSWDLTTIPDEKLKSEWARRNGAKTRGLTPCPHEFDPKCPKCQQREYRRRRRAEGKDLRPEA
jgi:hypothetical protein